MEDINKSNVYEGSYIPYINKWGKITNCLGILFSFGPAFVLAVIFDIMPPSSAIVTGFISIAGAVGVLWFVEPVSYFPIIGVAGTYMAFMSGNISNLRIPCAAIAQKIANVEPGTNEGSIVAALGMSVSIIVNIVILAVGVFAGSAIVAALPESVVNALNYLLPSLFGAIFVQFAIKKIKLAPVALALGLGLTLSVNAGVFNFIPGGKPTYLVTLGSVFGTIIIASLLYKKKLI